MSPTTPGVFKKHGGIFMKLAIFLVGLVAFGIFWRKRVKESKNAIKETINESVNVVIDKLDNIVSNSDNAVPSEQQKKIQRIIDGAVGKVATSKLAHGEKITNEALNKIDSFLQNSITGGDKRDMRLQNIIDKLKFILMPLPEKITDRINLKIPGVFSITKSNEKNINQLFEDNVGDFDNYVPIKHNDKDVEKIINTYARLVHFYKFHDFGWEKTGYKKPYVKTLILNLLKDVIQMSKFKGIQCIPETNRIIIDDVTITYDTDLNFTSSELILIKEQMSFGKRKLKRKSKKRSSKKRKISKKK